MQRQPLILLLRPHPVEVGPLASAGIVAAIPVLRVTVNTEIVEKIRQLLSECDWLILTSPRAPAMLQGIMPELANAVAKGLRVAVVGPKTAEKLREELGLEPSLVPESYTGRVLAEHLVKLKPRCVLIPRSEKATRDTVEVLRRNKVRYIELPLYRVEPIKELAELAAQIANKFDYVVLTSPSIAEAFVNALPGSINATIVAIGPTTAKKLKELGMEKVLMPDEYTLRGVAKLIIRHWGSKDNSQ